MEQELQPTSARANSCKDEVDSPFPCVPRYPAVAITQLHSDSPTGVPSKVIHLRLSAEQDWLRLGFTHTISVEIPCFSNISGFDASAAALSDSLIL